jgi:hypothetical protein
MKTICLFFAFFAFSVNILHAVSMLRVFLPSQNPLEKAGFILAQKKNFYLDKNLIVNFVEANQNDPLTALDYGLADIVQESLPIALEKGAKNPAYTLYAQLYQMPTTTIACIKPGVENLQQLAGKNIGYSSPKDLLNTQIWFAYMGFNMEGTNPLYKFERFDNLGEAFSRGKLSCGVMERHQVPLVTSKTTSQFSFFSPTFEQGGVLSEGLYINETSLQSPDFKTNLDLFLKASEAGWRYCFEHKEEFYMQILDQKFKDTIPLEVVLRTISLIEENFDFKAQIPFGFVAKNKINYTVINMLKTPNYSQLPDYPKNSFFLN